MIKLWETLEIRPVCDSYISKTLLGESNANMKNIMQLINKKIFYNVSVRNIVELKND